MTTAEKTMQRYCFSLNHLPVLGRQSREGMEEEVPLHSQCREGMEEEVPLHSQCREGMEEGVPLHSQKYKIPQRYKAEMHKNIK